MPLWKDTLGLPYISPFSQKWFIDYFSYLENKALYITHFKDKIEDISKNLPNDPLAQDQIKISRL